MSSPSTSGSAPSRKGPEIPLVVVGCDFRHASAAFRSMLVSTPEIRKALHESISRIDEEAGFLTLETCNRIEWLVSTEDPHWMGELLQAQILKRWSSEQTELDVLPEVYVLTGRDAARHVFRLVSGMESLAAGEAEIAGQFQKALQRAISEHTSSRILNGMGRFAGGMAKTAHRLGYRSAHARGIHVLVARLLKERWGNGARSLTVLVAGMGEIGRKCADFVEEMSECTVHRLNRTVESRHKDVWTPLSQLPQILPEADALIIATGARQPLFDGGEIFSARTSAEPLLVVDVGIPRQVSESATALDSVEYIDVDGLVGVEIEPRAQEIAKRLDGEVMLQVDRFRKFCSERHLVQVLRCVQEKRLEMTQGTICRFVDEKLGDVLSTQEQTVVVEAMRQMVKNYSSDVFDSLHSALEEFWSTQ